MPEARAWEDVCVPEQRGIADGTSLFLQTDYRNNKTLNMLNAVYLKTELQICPAWHFQMLGFRLTKPVVLLVDFPLDRRLISGGNAAKREREKKEQKKMKTSLCGSRAAPGTGERPACEE